MLGSQEKFLEQKVNVKFFTVDPYTPCYRVSRPFPIWSIWQIWPLLGQKNMFFGGLLSWGNEIWIVLDDWNSVNSNGPKWLVQVSHKQYYIFHTQLAPIGGILGPVKSVLALQRRGRLCCYDSANFENTAFRLFFFQMFCMKRVLCTNISRPEAKLYEYITYWLISSRIANC